MNDGVLLERCAISAWGGVEGTVMHSFQGAGYILEGSIGRGTGMPERPSSPLWHCTPTKTIWGRPSPGPITS